MIQLIEDHEVLAALIAGLFGFSGGYLGMGAILAYALISQRRSNRRFVRKIPSADDTAE